MNYTASTPEDYITQLPEERKEPMLLLRQTILKHLKGGFDEIISYGMIGYVVPHEIYPSGYHCDPKQPLPYMGIASQKNFISFYHMGLYADKDLLNWFVEEYSKHVKTKLDMGKSCIRFKKPDQIPYSLIAELVQRMDVQQWIKIYETHVKK